MVANPDGEAPGNPFEPPRSAIARGESSLTTPPWLDWLIAGLILALLAALLLTSYQHAASPAERPRRARGGRP